MTQNKYQAALEDFNTRTLNTDGLKISAAGIFHRDIADLIREALTAMVNPDMVMVTSHTGQDDDKAGMLKPCPFCGCQRPDVLDDQDDGGIKIISGPYLVACMNCGCGTDRYDDRDDAIESWNQRADLVQPSSEGVKMIDVCDIKTMRDALNVMGERFRLRDEKDFYNLYKMMLPFIDRIEAALSNSVPDGMVMVPREPTDAMVYAGAGNDKAIVRIKAARHLDIGCVEEIYAAMIAAYTGAKGEEE